MLINEALIKITDEYLKESKGSTLNNPLHKFIRKEVPEIIIDIIGNFPPTLFFFTPLRI